MDRREGLKGTKRIQIEVSTFRHGKIKLTGLLEQIKNGQVVARMPNATTAAYIQKTAQGCAVGTFNAVNKARLTLAGPSTVVVSTTKYSGGTGAEDNVVFSLKWENDTGSSKTLEQLDIGYDLGGGGEVIYCQVTGLSVVIPNGETIEYHWTLSFDFASGTVTDQYRFLGAQMLYTGTFAVPAYVVFIDTSENEYGQVASLEAGGDGVETFHQWAGTYTGPVGGKTIDIVDLSYNDDASGAYTEDDITDKALAEGEQLTAHIKIDHDG